MTARRADASRTTTWADMWRNALQGNVSSGSNEFFSRKLNLSRSLSDVLGQDQMTNIRSQD